MTDIDTGSTKISDAASANSEPANWKWTEDQRRCWQPALGCWQVFASKWRNVKEETLHPDTKVLDLGSSDDLPGSVDVTRLLIRDCYVEAEKLVWTVAVRNRSAGVIFTGQPGIGKTVFIWYLLVRLLQKKQVVLLHLPGTDSLLLYHDGVYAAPRGVTVDALPRPSASSTSRPFIWSLFDVGKCEEPPELATVPRWCFPVQGPSPHESRYKTWRKVRHPLFTGFPLWTLEELARGSQLGEKVQQFKRHLDDVTKNWEKVPEESHYPGVFGFLKETCGENAPESVDEAFDIFVEALATRFGPIPRDVFTAIYDFSEVDRYHDSALLAGYQELTEIMRQLSTSTQSPAIGGSHCIFSLNPIGKLGDPVAWQFKFKSLYIGKRVSDRLYKEKEDEARRFVTHFSSMPQGKGLAGLLFEPFAHRTIAGAADADSWSLREMRFESKPPTFVLDDSAVTVEGFQKIKRKQVPFDSVNLPAYLTNDEYYVARAPNPPFFDSFLVNLDFCVGSAHIWILQMATADVHGGSPRGYQVIRSIIEKARELVKKGENSGQPSPAKKPKVSGVKPLVQVHYMFVRPAGEKEPLSKWVLPKGWDVCTTQTDHRGNGYVLDVPLV